MIDAIQEEQVYRTAEQIFERSSNWVTFFREVLGTRGVIRQTFPTRDALSEFERTAAYSKIQQMLNRLRARATAAGPQEPTRVITVRLPKSLHDMLRAEAYEYHTSMNKLCISKLLQFIDQDLVPSDS